MWIRADGAFEPIVDRALFDAAQADHSPSARTGSPTRRCWQGSGAVRDRRAAFPAWSSTRPRTCRRAAPTAPASAACFGPTSLVGFTPERDYRYIEINRVLRQLHPEIVADTIAGIEQVGGTVEQDPATDLLTVNGEFYALGCDRPLPGDAARRAPLALRFDTGL